MFQEAAAVATKVITPELAAAQAQLQQRRQQLQEQGTSRRRERSGAAQQQSDSRPATWHSKPLGEALRAAQERRRIRQRQAEAMSLAWLPPTPPAPAKAPTRPAPPPVHRKKETAPDSVVLYPDVALALLKHNLATTGRIWLLLRALDVQGRGWLPLATVRNRLTGRNSRLRVCGGRQLRNLLAQGEGTFWQQEPAGERQGSGRIWLRSTARVAAALNVQRLALRPVALPLAELLQGIGNVRAHFYASYHSSRRQQHPIARQTLEAMCGVSQRTQHDYERRAGVSAQRQWAVGPRYDQASAQDHAWRHGRIFRFTDYRGTSGKPGASYIAWQLPNSYEGPHAPICNKGRRKQINRQLADLSIKGITGNGNETVETACFHASADAAVRHYNRSPERDAYWPGQRHGHRSGRHCQLWHLLPAEEKK